MKSTDLNEMIHILRCEAFGVTNTPFKYKIYNVQCLDKSH
jgi:hypothetical protein